MTQTFRHWVASWVLAMTVPALGGTNGPLVTCDNPVFDFGTQMNTEDVLHTFQVSNIGDAPLTISQVRTGCGCTKADLDRNTIPPGETASLSTRLTLRGHSGVKRSTIYLHTNDPAHPVFLCQYQGTAVAELEIVPPALHFEVTPASSNQTASTTIRNATSIPIHPLSLESPSSIYTIQLATNQPGQQYTLTVTCVATAATESIQGIITLLTDHPRYPKLSIPLSLAIIRDLNAYPSELTLKETTPDKPLDSRFIVLQTRNNASFAIEKIDVIPATLPVAVQSVKPYWIRLKVGPLHPSKAMDGTIIRIHTNLSQQPVIDIPVRVTGI